MSTEPDYAPVGIVDDRDTLLTTLQNGDLATALSAIDSGVLTGGRWVIASQAQPGLFRIAYDSAVDTSARLVVANAALLEAGRPTSMTVHDYDHNQLDARSTGSATPHPRSPGPPVIQHCWHARTAASCWPGAMTARSRCAASTPRG